METNKSLYFEFSIMIIAMMITILTFPRIVMSHLQGWPQGPSSDARGQAVIISAQIDLHNSRNTNTRRYENTNIQEGNHISTHL